MTTDDTSGVHVWLIMMKAYQSVQRHAERSIQNTGLCFSDFIALEILLHKCPIPISTIGEKLLLTSGSLTATMDRLEKKGFVERQFDPSDRRVRIINLTPSGKNLIEMLFAQHCQDMENALQDLSVTERQQLMQLLKKTGKAAKSRL